MLRVNPATNRPPSTSKVTCTMSVNATALSPPYSWYASANRPSKVSASIWSMPVTWATAIEPSHTIEVRLTNTYSPSQNTAIKVRMRLP
ncbi:hypothetical protein D3C71_2039890 [compost metagenome]